MQGTFHWVRVQVFCYATEREDLIQETLSVLLGGAEFEKEYSEGEHGNPIIIMQAEISKEKECAALFSGLGSGVIGALLRSVADRVDDDCVFYMRLDKQRAVKGMYSLAHHGDVISITGKLASHPARKEIAVRNMTAFLSKINPSQDAPSE